MAKIENIGLKSKEIKQEQIEKLRTIFPEVVTEGKIDFDKLKLTLGSDIDASKERYGMSWAGKSGCFKIIQEPSIGTLKPVRKDSVDFDTTENLFIEGDNLEVLKLLQKSYYEKVKMIYIDPPYNTGNEFVYPDNYAENLQTYLQYTGQIDAQGKKFSTNTDSSGRYHSNWMNMMYPRLFLAKNLLKNEGVIFISIDDNEVHNLRAICNEIFGEENFIAQAGWQKVYSPKNQAKYLSNDYEYILIYAKNISLFKVGLLPRTEEMNERYSNSDQDPRGAWQSGDLIASGERTNGHFIVLGPKGDKFDAPQGKHWAFSKERMDLLNSEKRLWFGNTGKSFPRVKQYLSEVKDGRVPSSLLKYTEYGHTDEAKKDFIKLFGEQGKTIFETLKPIRLIMNLTRIANFGPEDIVLDFFAGSGTTAQAVLELNKDGNHRKFICVQLPEPTAEDSEAFKAGYKNIAEICKERIRRVIKNIKVEQKSEQKTLSKDKPKQDLGFKVFKLDHSNFKIWDTKATDVQKALTEHIEQIKESANPEEILYEILLKDGFELTTKINKLSMASKDVYSIEENMLLICLDHALSLPLFKEMKKLNPHRVVVLDKGFKDNDQLKTNAVQSLGKNESDEFILRSI